MASVTGKKIVEEVSGWLRVYDDGSVNRSWTGPPELEFFVRPVPPHREFIDGIATNDVVIDPNTNLTVRIYIPQTEHSTVPHKNNTTPKLPLFLHFHGGGFCFSQPDWFLYYHFYSNLARKTPCVLVSVYLPLAPEHKLPAACDAASAAFTWLGAIARSEAHESWLVNLADFNHVFLIGDTLHPGFLRAELRGSFYEKTETPFLTRDMINKFMDLAVPVASERSKDHPVISPMGPRAPPLAALSLPPVMVAVAEEDLLFDTEMEYCEAMKGAGKEVEVVVSHGVGHCFYLNKIAIESDPKTALEVDKLIQAIVDFVSKH
ncbi:probable carboxylesterase 17 [Cajanus cajan]|uniref:probable carboxylesterase 17 n=1 Tax=Cajanus cajan TaxID=3821 RepID=UPI00098D7F34|nr:probable carboxylesterase 17 [Cajanus cajan]